MKAKRKSKSNLHLLSIIWGLMFTSFILLAVGSYTIDDFIEHGSLFLNELRKDISNPLDPTLYFFMYIIGYAVIWWKPLWGSIIIITASIYYVSVAGFGGPLIFAAPGFLVGALYMAYWLIEGRIKT
jgi:hypothetical protein